jgi:hypothetical protein
MTENPTPAMAKPTETLSSAASQGRRCANISRAYEPASHASMAALFAPMAQPP